MLEEKIMNKLYKTIAQVDKEAFIQQFLAFSLRLLEVSFIYINANTNNCLISGKINAKHC